MLENCSIELQDKNYTYISHIYICTYLYIYMNSSINIEKHSNCAKIIIQIANKNCKIKLKIFNTDNKCITLFLYLILQ